MTRLSDQVFEAVSDFVFDMDEAEVRERIADVLEPCRAAASQPGRPLVEWQPARSPFQRLAQALTAALRGLLS